MADVGRLRGGGDRIEDMVAGAPDQDALLARLTLLAEASTVLTETLDPDTALYRLAQLVVPVLGDWCGVHVMDEAGAGRTAAAAHPAPAGAAGGGGEPDASPGRASTPPVAAVPQGGGAQLIRGGTDGRRGGQNGRGHV